MAANDSKKYYWLKLEKDFFKRHDIEIIESMENGKDYILFYLKLLCESTSHEGYLRFSEMVPYNEKMLATITRTNIDIVKSAVQIFSDLKMMSVLDDGTIYLEQVAKMIGCETGSAIRKRELREKDKVKERGTMSPKCLQEIDIEIEKEIDIDVNDKSNTKVLVTTSTADTSTHEVVESDNNSRGIYDDDKLFWGIKKKGS